MPAGDRTGPTGMGPMTGRGAGYCAGYEAPGHGNPWPRMGMGWGRGRGRGWRYGYGAAGRPFWGGYGYSPAAGAPPVGSAPYDAPPAEDEIGYLRTQAEWLRDTLENITIRIEELEQQGEP